MKVLFTMLFPRWQSHAIAEANFIEEHLAAGDEVTVLTCDAMLKACDANPGNSLSHCLACMGLRGNLLKMLSAKVQCLPLIDKGARYPDKVPCFESLDALKQYEWNGNPVGPHIISSLISATGNVEPDTVKNKKLISRYIVDYCAAYTTALSYLDRYKFDMVYVFNGRFVPARAWLNACIARDVTFVAQERLGVPDRAVRVKNDGIHNPVVYTKQILDFWEAHKSESEVANEAKEFYEERPKGRLTGWYSFVTEQNAEQLPADWDASKQNIAIFASTESEFMGLPEYFLGGAFPDQRLAYYNLVNEFLNKFPDFHFYIRIHPNSEEDSVRWWEDEMWKKLTNATIVPPASTVSSYTLMWSCQKTVAWLTTMGIEATYWGKPSIILGNAFYVGLDAVYEPQSLAEAVALIADIQLPPKSQDPALAYGAFNRCGIPKLPFSEAITACKLTFKGQQPNAHPDILRSLWNWENIVSKAPAPAWAKRLWQYWEWRRLQNRVE